VDIWAGAENDGCQYLIGQSSAKLYGGALMKGQMHLLQQQACSGLKGHVESGQADMMLEKIR
jgi:hypothetical protein